MANVIEQGLQQVQKTEFIINDRGGFEVRNAFIFWRNFSGIPNKFKNATRNFNLAVTPEMGKILLKNGWRVRERELRDRDDELIDTLYFINIKVNMNVKNPPLISLYSEFKGKKVKTPLDINTIGELDRIDIIQCDLQVNAYESSEFPGKITGYLHKLNAIQESLTEFGGLYDDWMDEEKVAEGRPDCLADGTCSLEDY